MCAHIICWVQFCLLYFFLLFLNVSCSFDLEWNGKRCRFGCWPLRWGSDSEEPKVLLVAFGFSFIASICSNTSKTSFMEGLFLGSASRHFKVSCAACTIALDEYWPSILASMMVVLSFFFCESNGFNHSIKFCWPVGRFVSSALRPDSISSSTTPKPYTSLFTYKWPVYHTVKYHIRWFVYMFKSFVHMFMIWTITLTANLSSISDVLEGIHTCCNVLRSSITISSHDPGCHMWLSTRRPQFRQAKIWYFGIVVL